MEDKGKKVNPENFRERAKVEIKVEIQVKAVVKVDDK